MKRTWLCDVAVVAWLFLSARPSSLHFPEALVKIQAVGNTGASVHLDIPLHNDHNVYVLGAGFSRTAELPLISDFLLRMRDSHEWLLRERRLKEAEAVGNVLQFRLNAASAAYWVNLDLENIEDLFSLASASKGEMQQQIQLAIAATLDFARSQTRDRNYRMTVRGRSKLFRKATTVSERDKYPHWARMLELKEGESLSSDELGPFDINTTDYAIARLLGMFQNGSPVGRNTFITFNYDTILEESLEKLRVQFSYGFKRNMVDFQTPSRNDSGDSTIHVLKLHGSMNWARNKNRTKNKKSLLVFSDYAKLRAEDLIPELVPPTWKKIFESQLEAVWETAVQGISTATRIIVIGFSMPPTDVHFQYLLAAGLQNNLSLRKILFVNPISGDELELRVRRVLRAAYVDSKQIEFVQLPLSDFVKEDTRYLANIGRPHEYGVSTRVHWIS